MTDAVKKRWLVLSYFSLIDGMACAQHIDDRIPCLNARGIEPLMLTGICGARWRDVPHERAMSAAPSGLRFELRHLKRKGGSARFLAILANLGILPFYLVEKLLIDLDSQWSWFPLAIVKGSQMCRAHGPELIYSTGGPASAHLAASVIAKRFKLPWIAEFQDPLVHEDWLRSRRALKLSTKIERLICARANAVVFLTDGARKNADARTGLGKRGAVIYPGSNPATMPAIAYKRGAHCRFAHFGSLGGSRNLSSFLEALRSLLRERPDLTDVLRLDIYGSCDPLSRKRINEFDYSGVIRDFGRVPRLNSLTAMKQSDFLLLIQNTELFSSETIPSKTYEYLHTGRPVLGLVHRNPELGGMLANLGHRVVEADNPANVRAGIADCHQAWLSGQTDRPMPASPYTVEVAARQLLSLNL